MYYIETKETLREATPYEVEVIDFCRQLGEDAEVAGFDTRILDEKFEELSGRVENSRWSRCWGTHSYHEKDPSKKGVIGNNYFDHYCLLSEGQKAQFWAWVHGEWDFSEEIRWKVAGCHHILLALHMAEYIGDGKLRLLR